MQIKNVIEWNHGLKTSYLLEDLDFEKFSKAAAISKDKLIKKKKNLEIFSDNNAFQAFQFANKAMLCKCLTKSNQTIGKSDSNISFEKDHPYVGDFRTLIIQKNLHSIGIIQLGF